MCTGTVTESQQPMETGCSAVPPAVPFLPPTCLVWKTPKVGTVYRAIACKTFPRSPSDICAVNAAELRPHLLLLKKKKKSKKKHFACFQTQASHADRRARRGSVRLGSPSLRCASLASPVCGKHCHRAGCQIPESLCHLFLHSSALGCRHMFEGFAWWWGSFFPGKRRRRRRRGALRLPTSPRDPKAN